MDLVQKMEMLSPRESQTQASDGMSFQSVGLVDRIDDQIICPMPRKAASVSCAAPKSMKPFWQLRSVPPSLDCEASHEILEIFRSKSSCGASVTSFGFSPPFLLGSPPSRAGNPIVHNAEFSHQCPSPLPASSMHHGSAVKQDVKILNRQPRLPLSTPVVQTKSAVSAPQTYRASPCVRVEGFECPARSFECTSREMRRHVPAIA